MSVSLSQVIHLKVEQRYGIAYRESIKNQENWEFYTKIIDELYQQKDCCSLSMRETLLALDKNRATIASSDISYERSFFPRCCFKVSPECLQQELGE